MLYKLPLLFLPCEKNQLASINLLICVLGIIGTTGESFVHACRIYSLAHLLRVLFFISMKGHSNANTAVEWEIPQG